MLGRSLPTPFIYYATAKINTKDFNEFEAACRYNYLILTPAHHKYLTYILISSGRLKLVKRNKHYFDIDANIFMSRTQTFVF